MAITTIDLSSLNGNNGFAWMVWQSMTDRADRAALPRTSTVTVLMI